MEKARPFDFAVASDWEYDHDFIRLLEEASHGMGLTTFIVTPDNLQETMKDVAEGGLRFGYLFDRASDTSPEFLGLQQLLTDSGVRVFEPLESLRWASDKATMHLEFISRGLHTPHTIILPPYDTEAVCALSVEDLAHLGRNFIIKPANTTGGGIGVVHGAETLQDVLKARQEYQQDKYLLQEIVTPLERDGRRFWFRGFYSCGLVQCAWWNDLTHQYQTLSPDEIEQYTLQPLFPMVHQIAEICKLYFFSTEIAVTEDQKFIVVDYVNESCDMRLQSKNRDGVPDDIVRNSAAQIAGFMKEQINGKTAFAE
ncbi:MAG: hypothetical protein P8184_08480 [Calditrichia bacterium]